MLSRVPTKAKIKRGMDPAKKKILFVLGIIFTGIVLYGLYNIKTHIPDNKEKISIKTKSGDNPIAKKVSVVVKTDGYSLNMRDDHNESAQKIGQIPDGTVLEAKEEIEGWYKVSYDGKEGWISKTYAVPKTSVTVKKSASSAMQVFKGDGFTFKYNKNWYAKEYKKSDGTSWIAVANSQLPQAAKESAYFVPIKLKIYSSGQKAMDGFKSSKSTKKSATKVNGVEAVKYTFIDSESSTEINVVELEKGGKVYDFYDNGGYLEDLKKILETFSLL